jgi:hypothetical protein
MTNYDPTDTEGAEAAQAEEAAKKRKAGNLEDDDFKWLMSARRGRRIVWQWLERAGVFRLSFDTDSMMMAFNEGSRNEGLRILLQIHALCPERYHEMVKEQNDGRKRNIDDANAP